MISFDEALSLVKSHLSPLPAREVPLLEATGAFLAEDTVALIDVPGAHVSLKDGYAVRSEDVVRVDPTAPVPLRVLGEVLAGEEKALSVRPGACVRVTAGAVIPEGADAVLAEEFTRREGEMILALADAPPGKNILKKGADIRAGETLLRRGSRLFPPEVGLLAAGGLSRVKVHARPRVFLLATGDEVVAPGAELGPGQIFASNLVTLASWCRHFGLETESRVVKDEALLLENEVRAFLEGPFEVLITSGGAWKGPKDLIVKVLQGLGWEKVFHRVRMGPGKAVGFGLLREKVVFCLPGGPPSNQMAFLNLALPGLFILAGGPPNPFAEVRARLSKEVSGERDWTQFFLGVLKNEENGLLFEPLTPKSRLSYLAAGDALLRLPEGEERIPAGEEVCVKVLKGGPSCGPSP